MSAGGLAILVWSCDRNASERAATPFIAAQAAAALDLRVEMLFTARSVEWLLPANGSELIGFGDERQPVSHYLQASASLGVRLLACSQAAHALGIRQDMLVPQCAGAGGMVSFIEHTTDPAWRTLVF